MLDDLATVLRVAGHSEEAEATAGRARSTLRVEPAAEKALQHALDARKAILGAGHPSLAKSMQDLARVAEATGRHADAIALYETALGLLQEP